MSKLSENTKIIQEESKGTTKEFKKVIVEGIAMYAMVHTPKKPYNPKDKPQYSIDLVVDEENAQKLLSEGLKVAKIKIDEDTKKPKEYPQYPGMKVFNLRRQIAKKDGTPISALEVVDSQCNKIPSTILVGNGSKVRVSVNPYKTQFNGKETTSHMLLGVQVLELVPYTGNSGSGLEKTTGFTVQSSDDNTPPFTPDNNTDNDEPLFEDD